MISGIGYLHGDSDLTETIFEEGDAYAFDYEDRVEHLNPYVYGQILIPSNIIYYDSNDNRQIVNYGIDEAVGRASLFWTPHGWISASVEYNYSNFETDTDLEPFSALMTHRFPQGANFFHPNGIFFRLRVSYIDQSGDYYDWDENDETIRVEASDQFWVIDAALGYRLPKRYGILSLEANNLFDTGFRFQDTDPSNPDIILERSVLATEPYHFTCMAAQDAVQRKLHPAELESYAIDI